MTILDSLQLNDTQMTAASTPGDVVVTAGAGSGKTRTLVARYLWRLESGTPLRQIVAITFTEKAAREMRARIRKTITDWLRQTKPLPRRAFWEAAFADLDAARIGTIHSLCAQVLRDHPVEAARLSVNPGFGILEEGRAAVLRARAVEEAMAWAAGDETASHLFRALGEFGLREAISTLLDKRLDAGAAFEQLSDDPLQDWANALLAWLDEQLSREGWRSPLGDLAGLRANESADALSMDKMEAARQAVLAHSEAADDARQQGDVGAALTELAEVRASTSLYGRKANWPGDTLAKAKEATRDLRAYFNEHLAPLANPRRPASWELDEQIAGLIWALHAVYKQALDLYAQARQAQNSLDFDDLEAQALALLREPDIRVEWRQKVRAVLVDEFQDTNERQREIVYTLAGFRNSPATMQSHNSLFVVGDSKQSIYRFRGADVAVFRRVQEDVARNGGRVISLDLTFRAHSALVEETNRLLAPILRTEDRPGRPFEVPFAPLRAHRCEPRPGLNSPFIELHLGLGQRAAEGRRAAANGLATRLRELRTQESIAWEDAALLFRASTAFPVYEDALERADIPFVTVAGRGFYDRPEVRNLLNALNAIADPTDNLALMGFMRSPAIGLSDGALYSLRYPPSEIVPRDSYEPCQIWAMLRHPALSDIVPPDTLSRALRGRDLVEELHDLAGRVSVAALLKRLLDSTHYRATLQVMEGGMRAQRNVDKLLADAHTSGLVSVREFAEYVRALRDVGARESEVPTEAGSAVQLMTVHKAKGLEFPIVIIADAAHGGHWGSADVLLDELLGVTLNLRDDDDRRPAAHRLASLRDAERDAAENRRLLYVAATRAREKLLVSGHTKILKGGRLSLRGWLRLLGQVVGLEDVRVAGTPVRAQVLPLEGGVECVLYPRDGNGTRGQGDGKTRRRGDKETGRQGEGKREREGRGGLVAPLVEPPSVEDVRESGPPSHVWRVIPRGKRPEGPAWVVGDLVHAALRRWRFPDQPGLEDFLRPYALKAGLTDVDEIHHTVAAARRILSRFQGHALHAEMEQVERHHETPYTIEVSGAVQSGVIDLLARLDGKWAVIEFKTDRLTDEAELAAHIRAEKYDEQVKGYVTAATTLLGQRPRALLVFLNVGGEVKVLEFDTEAKGHKIQLLNFDS